MKKVILLAIVFFSFSLVGLGQSVRADDNRRTIYNECVQLSSLVSPSDFPQYVNESSLTGRTRVLASEVGLEYVWNEVSANKVCKSHLKPDAYVWVVNGEKNPTNAYLDGCYHPSIKHFKNRVIPIEKKIEPVAVVQPVVPVCANIPGLTIEKAGQAGYQIDEAGVCTKYTPPPAVPVVPTCINKRGLSLERAYSLGYDVDEAGNCTKPQPQAPVVETCANDSTVSLAKAREMGLIIDKHGVCTERKRGNAFIGMLCGGLGGAGIGGATASGNRGVGALLGGLIGGGAGYGISKGTHNTWAGCAGAAGGFVGYAVKKKPNPPTGCPLGSTPTNDGRCGVKDVFPGDVPKIPGNGGPIPTGPNIPIGYPTTPCRHGADGKCLPPITSTPNATPIPTPTPDKPGYNQPGICRPGQVCTQSFNSNPNTVRNSQTKVTQQPVQKVNVANVCRRGEVCRMQ